MVERVARRVPPHSVLKDKKVNSAEGIPLLSTCRCLKRLFLSSGTEPGLISRRFQSAPPPDQNQSCRTLSRRVLLRCCRHVLFEAPTAVVFEQTQAPRPCISLQSHLSVMSSRLPIGVATKYTVPGFATWGLRPIPADVSPTSS